MNILLTMAFDGTAYHGFQVQQNALSICTVLQDAMQKVFGERPDVKGSSRTDAGVHATGYCISFHYETSIPMQKLPLALNRFLPRDIRVKSACYVPESFHARYSALGKEYEYIFLNGQIDDPFRQGYYYRVPFPLDADAMHKAGQYLIGRQDFAAFQSVGNDIQDTVREITHLSVKREGEWVYLTVAADGFLYHMVRIIAGTLLRVGTGRIAEKEVEKVLLSCRRSRAGDTLPAKGLFLKKVFYPDSFLTQASVQK